MYALLVTGPPGAGKSTTLEALSDRLYDEDVRHASLDSDAVCWAHPPLSSAMQLRHLQAICRLYRDEGYDLLLVSAPVSTAVERDALLAAVGVDDYFLVRLAAPEATLRRRIVEREPPGWSQLQNLIRRSSDMSAAMDALPGVHLTIDTEQASPAEVAAEILAACGRLST